MNIERETASRNTSAFFNIDVMSKCKLVSFYFVILAVFSTICFVSLSHAPPEDKRAYTGRNFKCESSFSFESYAHCQGSLSEEAPSIEDLCGSAECSVRAREQYITEQLHDMLPHVREKMLRCLFDSCNATSIEPKDYSPQSIYYKVPIKSMNEKHRYMYVEIAFPNSQYTISDHEFEIKAVPQVMGLATAPLAERFISETAEDTEWIEIVEENLVENLVVKCRRNKVYCDPVTFLRFGAVMYPTYIVDVMINAVNGTLPIEGRDALFFIKFGTLEFTNWIMGFKAAFCIVAAISSLYYNYSLNKVNPAEIQPEQTWLRFVSIGLIAFNDPLYSLEVKISGYLGEDILLVAHAILHVSFYFILMMFWLVVLDNVRVQSNDLNTHIGRFYPRKVLFLGNAWLMTVLLFAYVRHRDDSDPTWDPTDGLHPIHKFTLLFVISEASIYLFWLVYLYVQTCGDICRLRLRYHILHYVSLFVQLSVLLGFIMGVYFPHPPNAFIWTSYIGEVNLYVWALIFFYFPSAESLRSTDEDSRAQTQSLAKDEGVEIKEILTNVELA